MKLKNKEEMRTWGAALESPMTISALSSMASPLTREGSGSAVSCAGFGEGSVMVGGFSAAAGLGEGKDTSRLGVFGVAIGDCGGFLGAFTRRDVSLGA